MSGHFCLCSTYWRRGLRPVCSFKPLFTVIAKDLSLLNPGSHLRTASIQVPLRRSSAPGIVRRRLSYALVSAAGVGFGVSQKRQASWGRCLTQWRPVATKPKQNLRREAQARVPWQCPCLMSTSTTSTTSPTSNALHGEGFMLRDGARVNINNLLSGLQRRRRRCVR